MKQNDPIPAPDAQRKLVGNLTVGDGRHLIHTEGGELSTWEIVFRVISIIVVAGFTARAIYVGNATAWHLALPMVAQYFTLMAVLPVIYYGIMRHPDLRKDAVYSVRWWLVLAAIAAIVTAVRSWVLATSWSAVLSSDLARFKAWVIDAEMTWPILLAVLGTLFELPGRIRNLLEFGPPFSGVSLGCGMRFVVLLFGMVALPWLIESGTPSRVAWTLWTMILIAELLAVWMHVDIQVKLREHDEQRAIYRMKSERSKKR